MTFYFHKVAYVHYLGEVDNFYTWAEKFLPLYNGAKIIKIDRDFPKLWLQMYCHLFYGSQCTTTGVGKLWLMGCMWPAESVYVACKRSCTSEVHLYNPVSLRIKIADLNVDRIVCLTRLQWDFTVMSLVSLCCMNTLYFYVKCLLCRSYDALSHMQLSAVLKVVTVAEWAVDVFWITMHWSYGVCFSSITSM